MFLELRGCQHVSRPANLVTQIRLFQPRHSTTTISDIQEMAVQNSGRPIYGDTIAASGLDEMLISLCSAHDDLQIYNNDRTLQQPRTL